MKRVIVGFMIFFSSSLFAKANINTVNEYIYLSGTKTIIKNLPQQIVSGYFQGMKISKNYKDLKDRFDVKKSVNYLKHELTKRADEALLKQSISFYKTKLGRKFVKTSLLALDKKNLKKSKIFYKKLRNHPLSYQRVSLMNNFVDRLDLLPTSLPVVAKFLAFIQRKIDTSKNREKIIKLASSAIKENLFNSAIYIYRNFSNKEIKKIIEYSYTNASRYEYLTVSKALKEIVSTLFEKLGNNSYKNIASAK